MSIEERYTCQLALPDFDAAAQQKLTAAKVLVVGAGGLGCPMLQYLVATGVGTIGIADHDVVSVKNLHRQILYTPGDEGKKKALAAKAWLQKQNPGIKVHAHDVEVSHDNVAELIASYDIIADCTDNFDTRYLLNDVAVLCGKPLVYGAIYQYEGQVAIWNVKNEDGTYTPNYRDLYSNVNAAAVPNCADGGVLPTIAGIIGCIQANEVIKYITGIGETLAGKLLVVDAQTMQSRLMKLGYATRVTISSLPQKQPVREITTEELNAAFDRYLLIDVRSAEERSSYNIGGVHIPLQDIHAADITTDKPIVCYCATGKRSVEAAKLIQKNLPQAEVFSLKGGVKK